MVGECLLRRQRPENAVHHREHVALFDSHERQSRESGEMKFIVCLANRAESAYPEHMNWEKIIILLYVILIAATANVSAQTPAATQSIAATTEKTNVISSDELKIALMEKELQVSKDFTEHILATVYFSLGTVVLVLFAMVGFGWFQNIRAYERDKEALSQSLTIDLNKYLKKSTDDLEKNVREQFLTFDSKVAKIFESLQHQTRDLDLYSSASIFSATHLGKTPDTDLAVFIGKIRREIGRVSPTVLNEAVAQILAYYGDSKVVSSLHRTELLELIQRLPAECSGHAEHLREILARK